MIKPTGHMEVVKNRFGARVYFNGQELFVLEDGFEVNTDRPMLPVVTMTFAPETLMIRSQEDA